MGTVRAEQVWIMFDRESPCQENGGTGITCVLSICCSQLSFSAPALYLNAWTGEIKKESCYNLARKTVCWDDASRGGNAWGHEGALSMSECIRTMLWWGACDNSYKDYLTREHLVPSVTLSPSSPFHSSLHLSEWIAVFPFLIISLHVAFFSKNRVFPPETLEKKKDNLSFRSMRRCSMGHEAGQN